MRERSQRGSNAFGDHDSKNADEQRRSTRGCSMVLIDSFFKLGNQEDTLLFIDEHWNAVHNRERALALESGTLSRRFRKMELRMTERATKIWYEFAGKLHQRTVSGSSSEDVNPLFGIGGFAMSVKPKDLAARISIGCRLLSAFESWQSARVAFKLAAPGCERFHRSSDASSRACPAREDRNSRCICPNDPEAGRCRDRARLVCGRSDRG